MKRFLTSALLGVSLVAATTAFAGEGYLTSSVYLRAGPDFGYPSVVRLRAGTPVGIEGCVDDWSWCDVTTGEDRGWIAGSYLQEEYDGRRVLVRDYGVRIGIPIVAFVFGDYWDHYYRGRSWYGHRERWSHVQPRYYRGGSYGHSGGSYRRSGSAYGTAGGSYRHSGSSYSGSRDSTYRDSHRAGSRDTQSRTSVYRSGGSGRTSDGSRRSAPVTTQPSYRSQRTQSTLRAGPTSTREQANTASRTYRSQANGAGAAQRNASPPRSAAGGQHSAAGQQRAVAAHQRNADRAQNRDAGRGKSDKGGGKGKDKNKNNNDGGGH
jgi:uncharacterized protein YraI